MQSEESNCDLVETQKEQILNHLQQLQEELEAILKSIQMDQNSKEARSKNTQLVSFEKTDLLNKAELQEKLDKNLSN
ncbi:unnamed protein product [Ceutorhynchus assimilis]|uniref:Uncharacterized protein n=1 Tax=Ceutorhynchus assimilis TaxID=467358 RepID=A0A9N9MYM1_9CUCU|nr:unnamed protein product [Ceutorhynchus assimilis]